MMINKIELSPKAQEIYKSKIKPSLIKLEEYRTAQVAEFNRRKEFAKLNGLIIFAILFLLNYLIAGGSLFLVISGLAILYWFYIFKPESDYKKVYEEFIDKRYLDVFFTEMYGFNYKGKHGQIAPYLLQESQLLEKYDEIRSKKYFIGMLGNTQLEFAEFDLFKKSKNNFKGAAIVLTTQQEIPNNIIISGAKPIKRLNRILLDGSIFDQAYTTYCNNKEHTKAFINNNVIQKILEFNWLIVHSFGLKDKAKKVQQNSLPKGVVRHTPTEYEIRGNKLLILLHTTDNFSLEADINKPVDNEEPIAIIEQKILAIYNLLQTLNIL